jgi:hypothetical protein
MRVKRSLLGVKSFHGKRMGPLLGQVEMSRHEEEEPKMRARVYGISSYARGGGGDQGAAHEMMCE